MTAKLVSSIEKQAHDNPGKVFCEVTDRLGGGKELHARAFSNERWYDRKIHFSWLETKSSGFHNDVTRARKELTAQIEAAMKEETAK